MAAAAPPALAVPPAAFKAEVLHQSLRLRVDLEKREVQGQTTLWVVIEGGEPGEPRLYRLHARQMAIRQVKVNGVALHYTYTHPVDLLRDFVPATEEPEEEDMKGGEEEEEEEEARPRMDGEALDLHYRCQLIASDDGELTMHLPPEAWVPPAPAEYDGEMEDPVADVPQMVLDAHAMGVRFCKVEIEYSLTNPVAGLRFESQPAHAYSVRCPAVLHDVDGPRCWFPCADRTADVFTVDMTVAVPLHREKEEEDETAKEARRKDDEQVVVLVGGGQLVGKYKDIVDQTMVWRYAVDTPITATAVSLVVGRFGKYVDPGVPWLTHHYLLEKEEEAGKEGGKGKALPLPPPPPPPPPPPRSWVRHSVEGMGPAMSFLADFFHLAPGGNSGSASAKAEGFATETPAVPHLKHRTIFVKGLSEASVPFHGLSLHRAEDLHPPRVFDPSMTLHLAMTEGLLASWLLPRVRPRMSRDRWIYHGVLGYLLLLYVRRRYGEHEYRYRLLLLMDAVTALERSGQTMPLQPPVDSVLLTSEAYSPANLELVRVKPPLILHMIEQRIGRKSLRDMLRSVACVPTAGVDENGAAAITAINSGEILDQAAPSPGGRLPSTTPATGPVRPQAVRTLSFLRLCCKTSTKGDFVKNLRECWLEGRGPAYFQVSYGFDRKATKPEVTLTIRQVVPPWGKLFVGVIRIRIMEDSGPYDYDREINEAEHVFSFKLHSKVRKTGGGRRKQPLAGAPETEEGGGGGGGAEAAPPAKKVSKAAKARAEAAAAAAALGGGGGGGEVEGAGGEKPKKRRKKADAAAAAAAAASAPASADEGEGGERIPSPTPGQARVSFRREEDEYATARREHYSPVVWVRLDPDLQWITEVEWEAPEYLFLEQLHRDADAVAQCLALRTLTAYPKSNQDAQGVAGVVPRPSLAAAAMSDCLRGKVKPGWVEPSLPVRMEAARALATWQNNHAPPSIVTQETGWRGLNLLLQDYKERFYDASGRVPLPADYTNEAEYQLQKALLYAISTLRSKDGSSPPVIWDFLRTVMEGHDNSRNPFDDSAFLRGLLLAVANLRIGPSQARAGPSLAEGLYPQVLRYLTWHQEVGSYDHAVVAAALRALCNLELVRGGKVGERVDFLQYAKPLPDGVLGEAALANPSSLLPLRLAALEAVAWLRAREPKTLGSDAAAGVPPTPAALKAGEGLDGPRRALQWVLNVVQHEKATGSVAFQYKAMQILFEVLRHPLDYRPVALHPMALAQSHFLDHLTHECPAYDKLELTSLTVASSRDNPYLNSLRSVGACALASAGVRKQLWTFITRDAWYNQPLRNMALALHQAIWGYDRFPKPGDAPPPAPAPMAAMEAAEGGEAAVVRPTAAAAAALTTSSTVSKDYRGLEDVFLELLSLRAKGVISLRSTVFDTHDWRAWHKKRLRRLAQAKREGKATNSTNNRKAMMDDLSEDEFSERAGAKECRDEIRKSNSKVRLKISLAPPPPAPAAEDDAMDM